MSVKCEVCGYTLAEPFTHFVKYEEKDMCETCFFNIALDKLGATPMQLDYRGNLVEQEAAEEYGDEFNSYSNMLADMRDDFIDMLEDLHAEQKEQM